MTIHAGKPPNGDPVAPQLEMAPPIHLVLPRDLVPVALLLLGEPELRDDIPSEAGVADLEEAGIVTRGALHPVARSILGPVASPQIVVSVEISGTGTARIATIWRRGSAATVGTYRDGSSLELHPVSTGLIPFHLAALTRLRPRPTSFREPLLVDAGTVAGLVGVDTQPRSSDRRGSTERGTWLEPALLARLQAADPTCWRITALWSDPDGSVGDEAIEVIDAGSLGYWEVTPLPGDMALLTPTSVDALLRLLADVAERR